MFSIAGDINKNIGLVSFGKYQKSTTTQPSSSSLESYNFIVEIINTTFYSERSSRSGKTLSESSSELKFSIPLDDFSRRCPYKLRSARQLKLALNHFTILLLPFHKVNQLGPRQSYCLNYLQNQAQYKTCNRIDPTHSKINSDTLFSCPLVLFRELFFPVKWSKANTTIEITT